VGDSRSFSQIKKAQVFQPGPLGCEGEPQLVCERLLCFHEIASDQFCDAANVTVCRRGGKALWLVEPLGFDETRISCPAEAGCPCFLQGLPDESHPCFSLEGSSHQNRFAASLLRDLDVCSLICLYLKQGVCHAREAGRKSILGLELLELSF